MAEARRCGEIGEMLEIHDHQERLSLDLDRLAGLAHAALPQVRACAPGPGVDSLPHLGEIEVSVVSDEAIGGVHAQFMGDPDPTDVITFDHGEILVSADTAERAGREHGQPCVERELLLYIIHGFLHLHGYRDAQPDEAAAMAERQESVLSIIWPL